MKRDRRLLVTIVAVGFAVAAWMVFTGFMLRAALEAGERQALAPLLGERLAPLLVLAWIVAVGFAAFALHRLYRHFVAEPARLLEQAQVLLGADVQRELAPSGSPENEGLTQTINELVRQRAQLRQDIERKVQQASRSIEQERSRLAALMSELSQSVVVCNLGGRILLYNQRARLLFRALSPTPALAHGAELIGLDRSIYTVFDRRLVDHALESIRQRLQRGLADPSTQFVTSTPAGQLLRVQMAPVRDGEDEGEPSATALGGFVLMFDDITQSLEEESLRDKLLQGLTDRSRASLANIQAAIEMLDYPDLETAQRARFQAVIRDEVNAMSQRIQDLAARTTQGLKTRWPLEDMLGADLVSAAARRIEAMYRLPVDTSVVDATLWLKVDSFSLLQALTYLAGRLIDEFAVRSVQLRLASASGRAQLDLVWSGQAVSTETMMSWETDPMRIGQDSTPLTVRDVVDRHDGEFWFERERVRHEVFLRFLLPLARPQAELDTGPATGDSRPEYYDFDLFQTSEYSRELDDRPLAQLTYTVFDTETTGLDPSRGDEIIQIGAVRIVNGKLLTQEVFEQLIDPKRPVSAEAIPIHGLRPEMLAGQPTIEEVLPAFHAFAQDTVLVAHNAAFDMRFLQMKESATGVCFDQPVLDTLLLSALVHPNQESHRLEAIAERFDVAVVGRHTAMGDALVAAAIFLKLIPLLQEHGIRTLGQARAAAQETYYARLRY